MLLVLSDSTGVAVGPSPSNCKAPRNKIDLKYISYYKKHCKQQIINMTTLSYLVAP